MDNIERKIYRPEPNAQTYEWINLATTHESRLFRNDAVVFNMMTRSQIGRHAFVVEETEIGDRLRIEPPLTEFELKVLSKIPFFRGILQEVIYG